MGRSLSIGLALLAVFFALPSLADVVSSASSLRTCMETSAIAGPIECNFDQPAIESTSGTATISDGIFEVTLPTGIELDIVIRFTNPGCMIWNHRAAFPYTGEPANTSEPVEIFRITAPSGVTAGSKIAIHDLCVAEYRDGVSAGGTNTDVTGIVLEGADAANVTLTTYGTSRFDLNSTGDLTETTGFALTPRALQWDAEIDVSTSATPCDDINDAIAAVMESDASAYKRVRVYSSSPTWGLTPESEYADIGPSKACVVLHPMSDVSTYPIAVAEADRAVSLNNSRLLELNFDELFIYLNELGLSENASFIDAGGGYMAGHDGTTPWGTLGTNVRLSGNVYGSVLIDEDNSWNSERIPSPDATNPLNHESVSAHAWLKLNRTSNIDWGDLNIHADLNNDADDFICHFTDTWGSTMLPHCYSMNESASDGYGIQLNSAINANMSHNLRALAYGVVLGTGDLRGDVVYWSGCGATCTDRDSGVRGIVWEGGTVEGNEWANLIGIGQERRNTFRDIHWECGAAACKLGGFVINPYLCDGTSGSTPVDEDTPSIDDEATDCASSGGVSAAAPETSDDGTLAFLGRQGPGGDTSTTESISPSIFFGEDFVHGQVAFFGDGIRLGSAEDASKEIFTFHSALTRGGQADVGDSLAASVGLVDTTGASFRDGDSVFPGNYDNWVDGREEELFWWVLEDPASAGTQWDTVGPGSNECVYALDWPFSDIGASCTGSTASTLVRYPNETYLTRARVSSGNGFDTTESCSIGIGITGSSGTHASTINIPPVDGQDLTANENYAYALDDLVAPPNFVFFEIYRGSTSESGTDACAGAFTARVGIRGFPFDPFD